MAVLRNNQLSSGRTVARTEVIRKGQLSTDQTNSIGGSGRVVIGRNRLSDIPRDKADSIGVRNDRRPPPRIIIPPTLPDRTTPRVGRRPPLGSPIWGKFKPLPPDYKLDPSYRGEDYAKTYPPREPIPPFVPPTDLHPPESEEFVPIERIHSDEGWWEKSPPKIPGLRDEPGGRLIGRISPGVPLKPVVRPITGGGILRPVSSDPVTPIGKRTVIRGDGAVRRVGEGQPVSVGGTGGGGLASGLEEAVSSITSPENRTILFILIGGIAIVGFIAMRK